MDLFYTVLLMVLIRAEAQNVTEITAELGQDVSLTCSINRADIYWFMEIHHQLKTLIGRTFSSAKSTFSSPDFGTKFLISENWMVVKSVSVEDSRLYFCGRKINGTIVYEDAFRLISVPVTATPGPNTNPENKNALVIIVSFSLNVLLALALILTCAYMKMKGCNCCRAKDSAEQMKETEDMQNPQYEEIQLPPHQVPSECIYYKAQHPGSIVPQY